MSSIHDGIYPDFTLSKHDVVYVQRKILPSDIAQAKMVESVPRGAVTSESMAPDESQSLQDVLSVSAVLDTDNIIVIPSGFTLTFEGQVKLGTLLPGTIIYNVGIDVDGNLIQGSTGENPFTPEEVDILKKVAAVWAL